jgi:hypothetical protein
MQKTPHTQWLRVTLTADNKTGKPASCENVKSALLEVQHQGYPMCWPNPNMTFLVDVAEQIGPHFPDAPQANRNTGTPKKNS